ncbi:hypothetical protein IAT40_006505 [Kwoniella sp. CBS 6097]
MSHSGLPPNWAALSRPYHGYLPLHASGETFGSEQRETDCICGTEHGLDPPGIGSYCSLVQSYTNATRALEQVTECVRANNTMRPIPPDDEEYRRRNEILEQTQEALGMALAEFEGSDQELRAELTTTIIAYDRASKIYEDEIEQSRFEDEARDALGQAILAVKTAHVHIAAADQSATDLQGTETSRLLGLPDYFTQPSRPSSRSSFQEPAYSSGLIPAIPPITLDPNTQEFRTAYWDALHQAQVAIDVLESNTRVLSAYPSHLRPQGIPSRLTRLWYDDMLDDVAVVKRKIEERSGPSWASPSHTPDIGEACSESPRSECPVDVAQSPREALADFLPGSASAVTPYNCTPTPATHATHTATADGSNFPSPTSWGSVDGTRPPSDPVQDAFAESPSEATDRDGSPASAYQGTGSTRSAQTAAVESDKPDSACVNSRNPSDGAHTPRTALNETIAVRIDHNGTPVNEIDTTNADASEWSQFFNI